MKPTIINLKALQDIKNKLQTNIQNQVKQTVIKRGCSSCGGGCSSCGGGCSSCGGGGSW